MPDPSTPYRRIGAGAAIIGSAALLIAAAGLAAIWVALATLAGGQQGWMALVAGADAALIVRLAGVPRGPVRPAMALIGTLLSVVLANFLLAALKVGGYFGLKPIQAALRLDPEFAWFLARQSNGPAELAMLAGGLALAWWWSR